LAGTKLSANLIADLIASIPRDVVISAQQQWLPTLGTGNGIEIGREVASRANTYQLAGENQQTQTKEYADQECARCSRSQVCIAPDCIAAACIAFASPQPASPQPASTQPEAAARKTDTAKANPGNKNALRRRTASGEGGDQTDDLLNPTEEERRGTRSAQGAQKASQPERAARRNDAASKADANAPADAPSAASGAVAAKTAAPQPDERGSNQYRGRQLVIKRSSADEPPRAKAADQTDDLLNPTEEELAGARSDQGRPESSPA